MPVSKHSGELVTIIHHPSIIIIILENCLAIFLTESVLAFFVRPRGFAMVLTDESVIFTFIVLYLLLGCLLVEHCRLECRMVSLENSAHTHAMIQSPRVQLRERLLRAPDGSASAGGEQPDGSRSAGGGQPDGSASAGGGQPDGSRSAGGVQPDGSRSAGALRDRSRSPRPRVTQAAVTELVVCIRDIGY